MKVRRITLLLLSFLFIPSEAGEWTEWKRQKLNDNEVYRESVSAESAAFCPGCSDSELNPLKWVTTEEWDKLPGGRGGNPLVKMKGAPNRDDCAAFGQLYKNGCWQTGCLAYDDTGNYWKALLVAWDGGHHVGYWPVGRDWTRFLVNPGNSVSIKWVDWARGKGPFPQNTVYGDPNCDLAVATYYDSHSVWSYNGRQGAQVDKDGYVYWQDKTFDGEWQYDSNEYELLTVNAISRAIVQEFKMLEETKKCSEEDETVISNVASTTNKLDVIVKKSLTLSSQRQTKDHYEHSINWNVGVHAQFEAGAEPLKVTAGFTIDLGGTHKWGKSENKIDGFEKKVDVDVQPGQTVQAQMVGSKASCSFDYIAKVKLTYVTGESRIVEDRGRYKGVKYGNFHTDIRSIKDKPTNVPIPTTIVDKVDDLSINPAIWEG